MASGYSNLSEIQKDRQTYGNYSKPPKINLLNEKPRRESLVEQQLSGIITRPQYNGERSQQQQVGMSQQQVYGPPRSHNNDQYYVNSITNVKCYTSSFPQQQPSTSELSYPQSSSLQHPSSDMQYQTPRVEYSPEVRTTKATLTTTTTNSNRDQFSAYADLEADLASKEEKLKRELAYLNQYYGPWSRPKQIREPRREAPARVIRNDPRWVKECPSGPTSRPSSRASSTRSTTEADLMEKAAKLLQDVEEFERKPLKTQQILIEGGSTIKPGSSHNQNMGSVHTAIINVPNHEVDNKSPLPFAYDNFSTLGVRGNIASVGAAEPESPYPPIFPTIKRTPSPNKRY